MRRSPIRLVGLAALAFASLSTVSAQVGPEPANAGDDPGDTALVTRTFARANFVWPYASGPSYPSQVEAKLIPGTPGVITTPVGVFRVGSGLPSLPSELRTSLSASPAGGRYHFLLVSGGEVAASGLTNRITRDGGRVVSYDPNSQVMVAKIVGDPEAVASEPFHPALKLHPSIGRIPLVDPLRATSEVYTLDVLLFPGEDVHQVAVSLSALGANVQSTVGPRRFPKVTVEVHRSKLARIAALEPVMLVLENTPWMLLAEETTTTMQTGGYNRGATPYHDVGIDGGGGGSSYGFCSLAPSVGCTTIGGDSCTGGQGTCLTDTAQILAIVDSGIQLDAGDLSNERADAGWSVDQVVPGHRKVLAYESARQFGGGGDLAGCDLPLNSGRTHGHIVAATAIGNATNVASSYNGPGWVATDRQEESWALDGVAPGGKLVAYDAQLTPGSASCDDPMLGLDVSLNPGELYVSGGTSSDGALEKAHELHAARTFNLSFGKADNSYGDEAIQVDEFLFDFRDSMVFIAAGNQGTDWYGVPKSLRLQNPATAKNALAIGASRNAGRTLRQEDRAWWSSTGPAVNGTSVNRMAPQLMAPGDEFEGGSMGLASEFACRTSDNDQDDPVECDVTAANEGTSYAAPAAAGAGMLVRDYFGQGFYPSGARDMAEAVPVISGSLVKAALIASADFMTGANLARDERFNFEQGYGRIQLDNVLPLQTWAGSPSGLTVVDALDGAPVLNDLGGTISGKMLPSGDPTQSATFEVCNDKERLSVTLAWADPLDTDLPPTGRLVHDLDLRLIAPSGIEYRGNYFTDDNDRDGAIIPDGAGQDEDCPAIGGIGFNDQIDAGQWSLPVCENTKIPGTGSPSPSLNDFDAANTMEAIFLSPNADGEADSPTYLGGSCTAGSSGGTAGSPCGSPMDCAGSDGYQLCDATAGSGDCCDGGDLQTESGTWTIEITRGNTLVVPVDYSVVIAGGVCLRSAVSLESESLSCNGEMRVVVSEDTDGLSGTEVASRTVVQVVKDDGTVVDEEGGLDFEHDAGTSFVSTGIPLSSGTTPDPGNGVLDVVDGDRLLVVYTDLEAGTTRTSIAAVDCTIELTINEVVNVQYGRDSAVAFFGGCERNARGRFELAGIGGLGGYPDRYLDAGESIQIDFIFQSDELAQLDSVDVGLGCVEIDTDSPASCMPDGKNCDASACGGPCDPRRENNPSCDGTYMTIVDPVKSIGLLPALSALGVRFSVQMGAGDEPGDPFYGSPQPTPTVELLLRVSDPASGKSSSGIGVHRMKLNVDEMETFYSTDFPMGGADVQIVDLNDNEVAENPIYEPGTGFQGLDYRFETRSFGNLLVGKDALGGSVSRNQNLQSPWNFDGNDGGFTSGLGALTDESLVTTGIYNWGEDQNFNDVEDGVCAGDRSIRCFKIGPAGSDPRCEHLPGFPGNRSCQSIEDRAGDGSGLANFNSNWSTKGGCGWQTRAPATCDGITTRGCFTNDDCQGSCVNTDNPPNSTFDGCFLDGDCAATFECDTSAPLSLKLLTCGSCSLSGTLCRDATNSTDCPAGESCQADDGRCGGVAAACVTASQECDDEAGLCTGPAGGGGVWHTGVINEPTAVNFDDTGCSGNEPTNDCQSYHTISGTGNGYQWYSYLLTPVMEKVNQEDDPLTGEPLATVEITNWAWNQAIDLPDNFVVHSWEMDTDVGKILPVDLTSDAAVLNSGRGPWGAVTPGDNPEFENGWGLFAPMGTCGVKSCGGVGTASSGSRCEAIYDCDYGGCSKGLCDRGGCRLCDPPSACDGVTCATHDDCINAPGQTGTGATCDAPPPNTESCADVAECAADLGGPGANCIGVGTACFLDSDCQDLFGQDSLCTNPDPEDCLPVASGNSEAPCSSDQQCRQGECIFSSGVACHFDSECDVILPGDLCGNGTTAARAELCTSSEVSVNGQAGNDREGQNACFFQGDGRISEIARAQLGLAGPLDDDRDNDPESSVCSGDTSVSCESDDDCPFKGTTGPCVAGSPDGVDEYVTANGPKRNFDLTEQPWSGPDMRLFTLEDIYGKTGNSYQGALGFITYQGAVGFPAKRGFGEAIDDMVVEWREFTLEPDATDCAAGSCASVALDTDRLFGGERIVTLRVFDTSPYGYACSATGEACYPGNPAVAPCGAVCAAAFNDCDANGRFDDAGDDDDCDDDGTRDVVVVLRSDAEPLGERVTADESAPGSGVFVGSVLVTALGDAAGVLFVTQPGAEPATVTAQYDDRDDGTGNLCENSIEPENQGAVTDALSVLLDATCDVLVHGVSITDNGDGDDFPDTNETSTVTLDLRNECGFELTGCLMRVTTNDPDVDCVFNPIVSIPNLPAGDVVTTPPFQWRVSAATEATDPYAPPTATFTMTMTCEEIDGLRTPQSFELPLDLDLAFDPADQTTWIEGFEDSLGGALADGGTRFEAQNNDLGIPGDNYFIGLINGDGYRCQYSDPNWYQSGSYGNDTATTCYPATRGNHEAVFWQIDGQNVSENLVDGGRAKSGTRSMYYGVYDQVPTNPDATDPFVFTTPLAVIEAAGTTDPINLGIDPSPILSWWQQISLIDGRYLSINTTRSADRGIVALQLADTDDSPIGDWIKLVPFQNSYDTQAFSNYFNCMFDPIDDGNDEDDYFDPTDPNRRFGPSSTCFGSIPGGTTDFTWSCVGDTDGAFATTEVCNAGTPPLASDRPNWPPNPTDITGTWVESKVDLGAYKGRRVRLRYLVSSLKAWADTHEEQFSNNPTGLDDGWWIDDIQIDSALVNPAQLTVDSRPNDTLPACGAACTSVSAVVTVLSEQPTCDAGGDGSALGEPCASDTDCGAIAPGSSCERVVDPGTVVLDVPGRVLELNALGLDETSEADACHSGALQFRFLADGVEVRGWTEDPVFVVAPTVTTTYAVEVRCSTLASCSDVETIVAEVGCPATGNLRRFSTVLATAPGEFSWQPLVPATDDNDEIPGAFQVYRGPLADPPDFATGSLIASGQTGTSFADGAVPAGSSYYLFARDGSQSGLGCNEIPFSWGSGGPAEVERDDNATLPAP